MIVNRTLIVVHDSVNVRFTLFHFPSPHSKSRVPFYQRIFNNHLREQGIPILDDVMNSSFTQERLKQHDALTSSRVSKDTDNPSATSRTSGYVSASGDVEGKETNHNALESTFAHSQQIIEEEEEDEYISPMNIHEASSSESEKEAMDDEDAFANDDGETNDADVKNQENGMSPDTMKRIEAKIGTMQLNNTVRIWAICNLVEIPISASLL